jgi:MFS family permease
MSSVAPVRERGMALGRTSPVWAARPRISAAGSFWVMVAAYLGLMVAASAPSPIYVLYQAQWHFSELTVTVIYGAYALALLLTLLTVGGLSDFIGRKPVLVAGFAVLALSMVVFALADGVAWLYAARILQGLAAGALLGSVSAGLIDYAGPQRLRFAALANGLIPSIGLALGALLAGALVQYAPAPTTLVYALLGGAFALIVLAIGFGPEVEGRRPGALKSLAPRVRIAKRVRPQFLATMPAWFVTWAQLGMTLSLTTSLVAVKFGVTNLFLEGLVVAVVCAAGAVSNLLTRNSSARTSTLVGSAALIAGTVVTLLSLLGPSLAWFYVGSTLAGLGVGALIGGAIRALSVLPEHAERGEFFAGVYVVGYVALSVPAIIAGICAVHVGLVSTTVGYGIGVSVLALIAAGAALRPAAKPAS